VPTGPRPRRPRRHLPCALDELEKQNFTTLSWRPQRPLYPWPLGAAVALLLGWHLVAALAAAVRGWLSGRTSRDPAEDS
jgi:hypothetical protein